MKALLIIGLPLAVVFAAWYWHDALDEAFPWLRGWRTVIMNAIPAVGILATDLIGFLSGFSWDGIVSATTAIYLTLSFNVANIALRSMTTTPMGEK